MNYGFYVIVGRHPALIEFRSGICPCCGMTVRSVYDVTTGDVLWACTEESCGWTWVLGGGPPEAAEAEERGGPMSIRHMIATFDHLTGQVTYMNGYTTRVPRPPKVKGRKVPKPPRSHSRKPGGAR